MFPCWSCLIFSRKALCWRLIAAIVMSLLLSNVRVEANIVWLKSDLFLAEGFSSMISAVLDTLFSIVRFQVSTMLDFCFTSRLEGHISSLIMYTVQMCLTVEPFSCSSKPKEWSHALENLCLSLGSDYNHFRITQSSFFEIPSLL